MSVGGSYETFGAYLGEKYGSEMMVSKQTLYDWEKKHPEFLDSKKRGFACSQLFYEQVGIKGMMGEIKKFNVTAWIFNMKNRFGWRDRSQVEVETKHQNEMVVTLKSSEEKAHWEFFQKLHAMSDEELQTEVERHRPVEVN